MQRAAVDRQLGRGRAHGHASDVEAAQGNDKDSRQRRTARVQPQRAFIACVCGLLVPAGMLGCEAYDVLRESSRIGIRARALARGVEVAPSGHKSQSALPRQEPELYWWPEPEPELVAATSTIVVGRPAPAPQRSPTAYVTDPVEVLATPPELPTGAACEGAAQPARPLAHEVEWRLPVGPYSKKERPQYHYLPVLMCNVSKQKKRQKRHSHQSLTRNRTTVRPDLHAPVQPAEGAVPWGVVGACVCWGSGETATAPTISTPTHWQQTLLWLEPSTVPTLKAGEEISGNIRVEVRSKGRSEGFRVPTKKERK